MKVTHSSETRIYFHLSTRRYIPEDRTIHNRRCENLESYKISTNYNTCRLGNLDTVYNLRGKFFKMLSLQKR
jgi:hypothetical protein